MSWAPNLEHQYQIAAHYVDKILRGANAGDLPITFPPNYLGRLFYYRTRWPRKPKDRSVNHRVEVLDLPQSLSGYFIRQAGFCQIMRDYVGTQARQFYV